MISQGGTVVIKNEDTAWTVLEKALKDKLGENFEGIELKGWPVIEIAMRGKMWDASLTAKNMSGLIEIQKIIYKSLAILLYNTSNTNTLTKEEKESVEISFKINHGSSLLEINLGPALNEFIRTIGPKMTPKVIIIMVLGVAVTIGGTVSFRSWMQTRKDINIARLEAESRRFADEEETKRMEILSRAMQQEPKVRKVKEHAEQMYSDVVKSVSEADSVTIAGVDDVRGDTLKQLVITKRKKAIEERIDGDYRILKVDSTDPDSFKVTVYRPKTMETFSATLQNDIVYTARKNKSMLQKAEWDRTEIFLKVSAKKVKGEIRSATIIGVEKIST